MLCDALKFTTPPKVRRYLAGNERKKGAFPPSYSHRLLCCAQRGPWLPLQLEKYIVSVLVIDADTYDIELHHPAQLAGEKLEECSEELIGMRFAKRGGEIGRASCRERV